VTAVKRAVGAAVAAVLVSVCALILEHAYIADPDLRYPVVLLTGILGAIITLILVIRVPWVVMRERVRAAAPQAEQGLRAVGTLLVVTIFAFMGLVFGVSLMRGRSGSIQFWPLGIVLMFGGLGVYASSGLWRLWKAYRQLSGKPP